MIKYPCGAIIDAINGILIPTLGDKMVFIPFPIAVTMEQTSLHPIFMVIIPGDNCRANFRFVKGHILQQALIKNRPFNIEF